MAATERPTIDATAAATLRWLADHAAQGVFTTDRELTIRTWNRWLASATELAPADGLGRQLLEVVTSLAERGLDAH